MTTRTVLQGLISRSIWGGKPPEHRAAWEAELAGAPCPRSLLYLMQAYRRLRRRKGGNGFAISPIEWPDIDAFVRLTGFPLAPWEVEVIEDLDDLFIAAQSKKAE